MNFAIQQICLSLILHAVPKLAHFINVMCVISSFSCAIDCLYVASRVLHTLALRSQTGPDFITQRLKRCRSGVPINAVLIYSTMMLLAFMSRSGSPGQVSVHVHAVTSQRRTHLPCFNFCFNPWYRDIFNECFKSLFFRNHNVVVHRDRNLY